MIDTLLGNSPRCHPRACGEPILSSHRGAVRDERRRNGHRPRPSGGTLDPRRRGDDTVEYGSAVHLTSPIPSTPYPRFRVLPSNPLGTSLILLPPPNSWAGDGPAGGRSEAVAARLGFLAGDRRTTSTARLVPTIPIARRILRRASSSQRRSAAPLARVRHRSPRRRKMRPAHGTRGRHPHPEAPGRWPIVHVRCPSQGFIMAP